MLRIAASPLLRHWHHTRRPRTDLAAYAAAASIASFAAVAAAVNSNAEAAHAESLAPSSTTRSASPIVDAASLGILSFLPYSFTHPPSDLALPLLEAAIRAARLAATAAALAFDYRLHALATTYGDHPLALLLWTGGNDGGARSLLSSVYGFFGGIGDDGIDDDGGSSSSGRVGEWRRRRLELERAVERRSVELDEAQHAYVTEDGGGEEEKSSASSAVESRETESNGAGVDRAAGKRARKEAMLSAASALEEAESEVKSASRREEEEKEGGASSSSSEKNATETTNNVHRRGARRLLNLCRTNGGVYVKVGQHLANLDLLLPEEYVEELSALFDDASPSPYDDVRKVVLEDLGSYPEELFDEFSAEPFASASLAQVHEARCKTTGRKLAVKVQHRGLRETSRGDMFAMTIAVRAAESLFDEFSLGWIVDELTPQLPKELDFANEGRNAEAAAAHLAQTGLDCIVPRILWEGTSERVLCMEFEEGFRATDVESIEKAGMNTRDVAKLVSSVFNAQIFQNGFVHCDPHEANVLLREHPHKKGKPQIVLVDHGLYKTLDEEFQESYARLWKAIVLADIPGIRDACESLGVRNMFPLLSSMLTSRPFDEVIERSQTRSFDTSSSAGRGVGGGGSSGDKAVIRGYAQKYLKDIVAMLDVVPRQMLLLFKMNDCLRHVDYALGSPANTLVVAGWYASQRVYESDRKMWRKAKNGSFLDFFRSWISHMHVLFRLGSYELWTKLPALQ